MLKITKKQALFLLKFSLLDNDRCEIVCKGFTTDDDNFVEVTYADIHTLETDKNYKKFQIWTALGL